jgi:hypothetical protein
MTYNPVLLVLRESPELEFPTQEFALTQNHTTPMALWTPRSRKDFLHLEITVPTSALRAFPLLS